MADVELEDEEPLSLNEKDLFEFWCKEIKAYESKSKRYRDDSKRVIRRYRNESGESASGDTLRPQFNILWSNIQTILPATYSRTPKPEVERRFKDKDPVSRTASEILERAISYSVDSYDFDDVMKSCDIDFLLTARGTAWVRYVPYFDADENLAYEEVVADYVHWQDFLHEPARKWSEVTWVGKKAYLSKAQYKKRFPKSKISLDEFDQVPDSDDDAALKGEETSNRRKKILVYEIWDKERKEVFWLTPSHKGKRFLDRQKDPLRLDGFFPCPKPLLGTTTNDSSFPVSDYSEYESLAQELDEITARITDLTDAVKAAGIYDASLDEIEKLLSVKGNIMIPAQNYAAVMQMGGTNGAIVWYPLEKIVEALKILQDLRNQKIQEIYEVSGMSDIIRGASNPNETATAQQIKGQFATLRLSDKQYEIQRFAKDIYAIKGEIMAEHFSPRTLALISGVDLNDPVVAQSLMLLQEEKLRCFRIKVETDSTIAIDEQLEKQKRTEYLESVGSFIQQGYTIGQQLPALIPVINEMILFASRGFKTGRGLEQPLEEGLQEVNQQILAQMQQPPPPNPEMIRVQQEGQIQQYRLQLEAQKFDQKMQLDMAEAGRKANLEAAELQGKHEREIYKINKDFELKALEIANTPLNNETTQTQKDLTPAQVVPPVNVNVSINNSKKKRATMVTDPTTGASTAFVEDIPEVEVNSAPLGL